MTFAQRVLIPLVTLSLVSACAELAPEALDAPATTEPATTEPTPTKSAALLESARALASPDAWLSKALRVSTPLLEAAGHFETRSSPHSDATFVRVEPGRFEVRRSRRNSPLAVVTVATSAQLTLDRDRLFDSHADPPSFWAQRGDVFEQFLVSATGAPLTLDWRVELHEPIVSADRDASGALVFSDRSQRGVLRIPVPYGVDKSGTRLQGALNFELSHEPRLVADVHFTLPGTLHPPALLDPALAVVIWQDRVAARVPPRSAAAIAYDPSSKAIILQGGDNEFGTLVDTWAYDGSWQQLEPLSIGPIRSEHSLAYSASPPGILLFGGFDYDSSDYFGSTLLRAGNQWTEVAASGPPGRSSSALAYAASFGANPGGVLLFGGGAGGSLLGDTWLWRNDTWNQLTALGPDPRRGHALFYDPRRQAVLAFAGTRLHEPINDLWQFDGVRWLNLQTIGAPARLDSATAFDTARERLVVFGGEKSLDVLNDETWEWDSVTGEWLERVVDFSPPALERASMAYDPERQRSVLVGGMTNQGEPIGHTYEYRALGGSCESSAECDQVPCVDGACCAQASCGQCEKCSAMTGQCEAVINAADPGSCTGSYICNAAGACRLRNGTICASDSDCASGACADGVCCEHACSGACEACDSKGHLGTCVFVKGSARHGKCSGSGACGAQCAGDAAACLFTAKGVSCGSSCESSTLTESTCDGRGGCVAGRHSDCPNGFACDAQGACLNGCANDAECAAGLSCRDGQCVSPAAYCRSASTRRDSDGTDHACTPYACVSGACLDTCTSAAQCAPGLLCDLDGHCLDPSQIAPSANVGSGCGCQLPSHEPTPLTLLLAFGVLPGLALQRRRARNPTLLSQTLARSDHDRRE